MAHQGLPALNHDLFEHHHGFLKKAEEGFGRQNKELSFLAPSFWCEESAVSRTRQNADPALRAG